MSRLPRLYVDLSVIARGDAGTGIQRVVRAVWQALLAQAADRFDVIPVAGSARGRYRRIPDDFLARPLARLPWSWGAARLSPQAGDVFLGLDLAAHVVPRNRAQLDRWQQRGVKLAFVVYDLLPVLKPDWFSARTQSHYRAWLDLITRQADRLICISQTVAVELAAWSNAQQMDRASAAPMIATMRLGASLAESKPSLGLPSDATATLGWAREGHTVLMVGTVEPRKGYDQALAAFETLWAGAGGGADTRLLIVGRPGWKTEALQARLRHHPEAGARLRWIDNASDEYLEQLYAACAGLLLASRGEGFGLPLIEAAAHGKPVLVRDLPVFREVAPAGVHYFCGDDPETLANALRSWRHAGRPVQSPAADFSWAGAAAELIDQLLR